MTAPKERQWSDLSVGDIAEIEFSVGSAEMEAFLTLSGDANPLHLDDEFAARKGFEGRVVYGGVLVAMISRLIGMEMPGLHGIWTCLKLDFRNPLYLDEAALLTATITNLSDAVNLAELSFEINTGNRLVAKGAAEVIVSGQGDIS